MLAKHGLSIAMEGREVVPGGLSLRTGLRGCLLKESRYGMEEDGRALG